MPKPETKGITVRVDAGLHAEIRAYLEASGMTMGEFIALAARDELHPRPPELDPELQGEVMAHLEGSGISVDEFINQAVQNELHPKTPEMEGNRMERENMRTMAFQVPESLFQRIKDYLARNNMTQKAFVLGLIKGELDHDEELLKKQQEAAGTEEEEQDEGLSEAREAPVSGDDPEVDQADGPEETPAAAGFEGGFDEQDEDASGQEMPEEGQDEAPCFEGESSENFEEDSAPEFTEDIFEPDSDPGLAGMKDDGCPDETEGDELPGLTDGEEADPGIDEGHPNHGYVEGELGAAIEVAPMRDFGEEDGPAFPESDEEEEQDFGMSMGY